LKATQRNGLLVGVLILVAAFAIFGGLFTSGSIADNNFEVTVTYDDGTVATYPKPFPFNLIQGAITDASGKTLSKISWVLKSKPTWTGGAATATSMTGVVTVYLTDPFMDPQVRKTFPVSYTSTMTSGVEVTVASGQITAAELEGYNNVQGDHIIKVDAVCTMKVTLASTGAVLQGTNLPSAVPVWNYSYKVVPDGITSLGLTITGAPIYTS